MPTEFNPTTTTTGYANSGTSTNVAGGKGATSSTFQHWFEYWQAWNCHYVSGVSSIEMSGHSDGSALTGGTVLEVPVIFATISVTLQRHVEFWSYNGDAYEAQTLQCWSDSASGIGSAGTIATLDTGYIRRVKNIHDARVTEGHQYQAVIPIPGSGPDLLTNYTTLILLLRRISDNINRKSQADGETYISPEGVSVKGLYMPTLIDIF